jgi:hypothetical protein
MLKNKQEELWITNINRFQDITLGDLCLKVCRGKSINLLAKKKNGLSLYNLTQKQIDNSIKSGSIYQKGNHIKIRKVTPEIFAKRKFEEAEVLDKSSLRSIRKPTEIEHPDFPDLDMEDVSAEAFAEENADMDAIDRAPVLAVDPIFRRRRDDE